MKNKKMLGILITMLMLTTVVSVVGNQNDTVDLEINSISFNGLMDPRGMVKIPTEAQFTIGKNLVYNAINRNNYPVPEYNFMDEINVNPGLILGTDYDYMPGSYASHPIRREENKSLVSLFHEQSGSSLRGIFFENWWGSSYNFNGYGSVPDCSYNYHQGYSGVTIHPATGYPIASWHEDHNGDGIYERPISYYNTTSPFAPWEEPLIVNQTEENQYIWPYMYTGPSPLGEGYVRIYQIANNQVSNAAGNPCEDVNIMYIDIENEVDTNLDCLLDINNWNNVTVFTDWREKSCRPFQSFAIDYNNPGKVAFIGSCSWLDGDLGDMPCDEGSFVWESHDYGETWDYNNLHSDGPGPVLYIVENTPGFIDGNEEILDFIEVGIAGWHNTALFDGEGNLHWTYMQQYGYSDQSGSYYFPYYMPQAEMVWDGTKFTFHEVPELPGSDFLSGHSVPWNETETYPVITWSTYDSGDAAVFHENTQKQAINVDNNWMLQLWADGTYCQLAADGEPGFEEYEEHPIIYISVSSNNGRTWSEPINLTDINNPLFDFSDQITVYPYVCDKIEDMGNNIGRVYMFYLFDEIFGSSIQGQGDSGAEIWHCFIDIEFPNPGFYVDADGPYSGYAGSDLQFTSDVFGGVEPYTYLWDFGNGDTSTETNPVYSYDEAGNFTVTLTVSDSASNESVDITVARIEESDTTPPLTTCELYGEIHEDIYISDVTVTLFASDEGSGVDYTMFRLDDGDYETYTDSFIVTEDGQHTVLFYSVDNVGNIENEQSCVFIIEHPNPILDIGKISSGPFNLLSVIAEINNIGTTNAYDVNWSVIVKGGVFELINVTDEGYIPILTPGSSENGTASLIFGLGTVDIIVTVCSSNANPVERSAIAMVVGPFVIGIH